MQPIFRISHDRSRLEPGRTGASSVQPYWIHPEFLLDTDPNARMRPHDNGPFQVEPFRNEYTDVYKHYYSDRNVSYIMQRVQKLGGFNAPPDPHVVRQFLDTAWDLDRPGATDWLADRRRSAVGWEKMRELTEMVIGQLVQNMEINRTSRLIYEYDRTTHGIRGVFEIDAPMDTQGLCKQRGPSIRLDSRLDFENH
jgi:hypothetical protein